MKNISIEGWIFIILAILGIFLTILVEKGFFDEPNFVTTGYLIGSDSLTKNQHVFGLQYKNEGDKSGYISMIVSSDNSNVTFIKKEETKFIPYGEYRDLSFSLNDSSFYNKIGNFTIDINMSNGNYFIWRYEERCYAYNYFAYGCSYERII